MIEKALFPTVEHLGASEREPRRDCAGDFASIIGPLQSLQSSSDELTKVAGDAKATIEDAKKRACQAKQTAATFSSLSQTITNIAATIEAIGRRTKLLALNATIESGRIGDAGRPFVVVATEFKELAAETSKVAAQIAGHLYEVRRQTSEIVDAIDMIDEIVADAALHTEIIDASVRDQSRAAISIQDSLIGLIQTQDHHSVTSLPTTDLCLAIGPHLQVTAAAKK